MHVGFSIELHEILSFLLNSTQLIPMALINNAHSVSLTTVECGLKGQVSEHTLKLSAHSQHSFHEAIENSDEIGAAAGGTAAVDAAKGGKQSQNYGTFSMEGDGKDNLLQISSEKENSTDEADDGDDLRDYEEAVNQKMLREQRIQSLLQREALVHKLVFGRLKFSYSILSRLIICLLNL